MFKIDPDFYQTNIAANCFTTYLSKNVETRRDNAASWSKQTRRDHMVFFVIIHEVEPYFTDLVYLF